MYREVPFLLVLSTLIGRSIQLFGWVFLGFGAIFASVFLRMADLNVYDFGSGTEVVESVIVKKENAKAKINNVTVQKYHYKFSDESGNEYRGVSYSTKYLKVGEKVQVEYRPGTPSWSRIEGMRQKPFGKEILFVLVFPLIGFLLVLIPLYMSWRRLSLLRLGVLTKGVMLNKEHTSMKVNGRRVYKYTFKFFDNKGKEFCLKVKTRFTNIVEDEHEERVLYHPSNPSNACLVDLINSGLEFNEKGDLVGYSSVRAFFSILLPLGVFAALVVAAVLMK